MTERKAQSFTVQLALLAHVYKLEIIELCSMMSLAILGFAEDLHAMIMSLARYSSSSYQRRHR